MIKLKTDKQLKAMAEGGQIAAKILQDLSTYASPGYSTLKVEYKARELVKKYGVAASFMGHEGYQHVLVTCVNEEVVHAIPSADKILRAGDLLTIDFGVYLKGLHTDTAVTVEIGKDQRKPQHDSFLAVGRKALQRAIEQCVPGNQVGDLSHAMQSVVESEGYNVIRAFVGHGVGERLHESPQIPCYGSPGVGERLKAGMTLAVEVMYTRGDFRVRVLDDGWTTVTTDGCLSAMFEHTVAVTLEGPKILTLPKN